MKSLTAQVSLVQVLPSLKSAEFSLHSLSIDFFLRVRTLPTFPGLH